MSDHARAVLSTLAQALILVAFAVVCYAASLLHEPAGPLRLEWETATPQESQQHQEARLWDAMDRYAREHAEGVAR